MVLAEARALGLGDPIAPGLFLSSRPFEPGRAAYALGGGRVLVDAREGDPFPLPAGVREVHVARGPFKPSGHPRIFAARIGAEGALPGCAHELYETGDRRLLVEAAAEPTFADPDLPVRTSTSFAPQLARAVVHLVARPGDRVLDPVCGVGLLLVEAGRVGCSPTGWDTNARAARSARLNLSHQGLSAAVEERDALAGLGDALPFDALVADLPYGIGLEPTDLAPFAERLPGLARRWALVATTDLTGALTRAGHAPAFTLEVPKYTLTRYVLVGGEALPGD